MKQKHTKARKARRHSAFALAHSGGQSLARKLRREKLQPMISKNFGKQVVRTQRIFLKKDRFGAPIYKTIQHAAV